MSEPTAQRTLVKSPPELWAEVSDADSLARHLAEFGEEIRITRVEPETTVAWEGELASGTVQIEPSGWGTKVTLTATPAEVEPPPPPPPPEPEPEPVAVEREPEPEPEPEAAPLGAALPAASASDLLERAGFFSRMFGRPRRAEIADPPLPAEPEIQPPAPVPEPEPEPEPEEEPPMPEPTPLPERDPDPMPPAAVEKFLSDVLDSLGAAHHRPFARQ